MSNFFNDSHNKAIIRQFKNRINRLTGESEFELRRNMLITLVVGSMDNKPDYWNENCLLNIGWIGESFINRLSKEEDIPSKEHLDVICALCFRFMLETFLSLKHDLETEFEDARNFVLNNLDSFDESAKWQIEFSIRQLPLNMFKALANSEEINCFKKFNALSDKASQLTSEWESDLDARESRVNNLKDSLDKYENAFNFVGLFQGFDELATQKKEEMNSISCWLKILATLIVLPLIFQIGYIYFHLDDVSKIKDGLLFLTIPTISLIFISIYYFRVLLFNYKSVKSQLLQIDLRKTLCRFIQHYSDYSADIKKNDSSSLEKFENIIFSGIVSDEENLPSTFDGIEQLAKIIKSVKA